MTTCGGFTNNARFGTKSVEMCMSSHVTGLWMYILHRSNEGIKFATHTCVKTVEPVGWRTLHRWSAGVDEGRGTFQWIAVRSILCSTPVQHGRFHAPPSSHNSLVQFILCIQNPRWIKLQKNFLKSNSLHNCHHYEASFNCKLTKPMSKSRARLCPLKSVMSLSILVYKSSCFGCWWVEIALVSGEAASALCFSSLLVWSRWC